MNFKVKKTKGELKVKGMILPQNGFSQFSTCHLRMTSLKMTVSEQVISHVRSKAIAPGA